MLLVELMFEGIVYLIKDPQTIPCQTIQCWRPTRPSTKKYVHVAMSWENIQSSHILWCQELQGLHLNHRAAAGSHR